MPGPIHDGLLALLLDSPSLVFQLAALCEAQLHGGHEELSSQPCPTTIRIRARADAVDRRALDDPADRRFRTGESASRVDDSEAAQQLPPEEEIELTQVELVSRERIKASTNLSQLSQWLLRAATASSATDLFVDA